MEDEEEEEVVVVGTVVPPVRSTPVEEAIGAAMIPVSLISLRMEMPRFNTDSWSTNSRRLDATSSVSVCVCEKREERGGSVCDER